MQEWTDQVTASGIAELAAFAVKLLQDMEAVVATMVLPYSKGQTEGRIDKLKFVKRSTYGQVSSICSGSAGCTLRRVEEFLYCSVRACP